MEGMLPRVSALALSLLLSVSSLHAAEPRYSVSFIHALPNSTGLCYVEGINSKGAVVGYSTTTKLEIHGFLFSDGEQRI
jgi:probable HAF family extracellular repeat protein